MRIRGSFKELKIKDLWMVKKILSVVIPRFQEQQDKKLPSNDEFLEKPPSKMTF
ncbi:MAG: hypothetical protein ACRCZX_00810 [Cetobacterium sp.]